MKSYVQGLITGAVLVFAFMVLMGATGNDTEVGKYQIAANDREIFMLDTVTGTLKYYEKLGWNEYVGIPNK